MWMAAWFWEYQIPVVMRGGTSKYLCVTIFHISMLIDSVRNLNKDDTFSRNLQLYSRGYPSKRALPAMLTHGK